MRTVNGSAALMSKRHAADAGDVGIPTVAE